MGSLTWVAILGILLFAFSLANAYVRRSPLSTSLLYLAIGFALGPLGLALLEFDVAANANVVEHVAEVAVVVALFTGGLRLRLSVRHRSWRTAFLLAGPVMVFSIGGLTVFSHLVLGLPVWSALLVAAILAPTDPVLAGAVSVGNASDEDRVRYSLSGEAGLNDGTAFPFVVLALGWLQHGGPGAWLGHWAAAKLLWAIPVALVIGYVGGLLVGRLAIHLRGRARDDSAPNDFLALALIALSYAGTEAVGGWGFLAVFAAGVGLRAAELHVVLAAPHPDVAADPATDNADHPPAEQLVAATTAREALAEPAVAAGILVAEVLSFGETVDRLVEVALVIVIGATVATHWDGRAIPIAAALFFVIRPLATHVFLRGTRTTSTQRWLIGWFGVRGIGSFYYLGYALTHGAGEAGNWLVDLTVSVVALSVVVHGLTAKPVLRWYEQRLGRAGDSA